MNKLICFYITFLLGFTLHSLAQDTLYFSNDKKQIVRVRSVSNKKIEYVYYPHDSSQTLHRVPRIFVKRIHFSNGTVLINMKGGKIKQQEVKSSKAPMHHVVLGTSFKTDVFSWFMPRGSFMMEQCIWKGISVEGSYGFKTFNTQIEDNQSEVQKARFYKVGIKYYFGNSAKHGGVYMKPEFAVLDYSYGRKGYTFYRDGPFQVAPGISTYSFLNAIETVQGKGFLLNLGWQKVIAKRWVIDIYGGVGMGEKKQSVDFYRPYPKEKEIVAVFNDRGPVTTYNNFGFTHEDFNERSSIFHGGVKFGVIF